jgi:rhodanese-related sulfurtransferase
MRHGPGFERLVADAKTRIEEVTTEEVARMLDDGTDFDLLDVREAEEFAGGHLPGARHLCKGILERDIEAAVPDRTRTVVLYCGGGFRSALAAEALGKMGYRRALSMAGGWRSWRAEGRRTEG